MIPFVQLPYRGSTSAQRPARELRPWLLGGTLLFLLLFQLGLIVWMWVRQWLG